MEEVFGGFYTKLAERFSTFEVHPDTFVAGGDHVVATGHYVVTQNDGEQSRLVRFAHVFAIADGGRIAGVWQVADTARFGPAETVRSG
jgi:hypothetical protein